MFKNRIFLLTIILTTFGFIAIAQNNTNSPYTRYGYGDVTESNSGEQRAMGGTALGLRSANGINTINPASYSRIDSTTFLFDVGVSGLLSRFSDPIGNRTLFNANLEYITMQFPLMKNVGFSAGMLPYSFSGYNFYSTSYLPFTEYPDTVTATQSFVGLGGISQVYSGISVELFNHISLGVNAYYMFGTSVNSRQLNFSESTMYTSAQRDSISVSNFRFRYGLQFFNTFAKKHDVNLGLIYEFKKKMNATYTEATGSVLTELTTPNEIHTQFDTPEMYGIGLAYTYDKKLTFALDYTMQKWAEARFIGATDTLNNRSKIAFGVEYQPNARSNRFSDKVTYRAGLNISDPYYKINGLSQPKNFGISFGFGLPLKLSNTGISTHINTTFEYGKTGAVSQLREDYFKITFNAAFNETWFFKRKL